MKIKDIKDILEKNKLLKGAFDRVVEEASEIKKKVIAPCEWCFFYTLNKKAKQRYCLFCSNNFYEDFEDKSIDKSDDKK